MKDYTLTEAKEILQKYFGLLPRDTGGIPNELCTNVNCDFCMFNIDPDWGCLSSNYFNPEMIAKAEQYVKDHEQKVDWSKVPAGTPVLCWIGDREDMKVERMFLVDAGCKLWAVDGNNLDVAHAWEHMELADFDKSEK